ncbi:hypothetical protein ACUODJ_26990, partial [Escherichia sp. HC-CC]
MMPEIGNGLLCLALGIALLLSVYPLWGVARGDARMMASSRLFAWLLFMSVAGAKVQPLISSTHSSSEPSCAPQ